MTQDKEYDPNVKKPMQFSSLQKRANEAVRADELSKENPVGRAIRGYGASVPAGEKAARIAARQERNIRSFGGIRPTIDTGRPPAMAVSVADTFSRPAVTSGRLTNNQDMMPNGRNFKPAERVPVARPATRLIGAAMPSSSPAPRVRLQRPSEATSARRFTHGPVSAPGTGYIRNEAGETVSMGADGRITTYDKSGKQIPGVTKGFAPLPRQQGEGRSFPYAVSNVSAPPAEMQKFMRTPTPPGTRMRSNLEGKLVNNFSPSVSIAPQPAMGWEERKAFRETEARKAGDQLAAKTSLEIAGMENQAITERNQIDRIQAESAAGLQGAQAKKYGADADMSKVENDLIQKYRNAGSPEEKATAERELMAVQGRLSGKDSGLTEQDKARLRMQAYEQFNEAKTNYSIDSDMKFEDFTKSQPWMSELFGGEGAPVTYSSFEDILAKEPDLRAKYYSASPEEKKRMRQASIERSRRMGYF